MHFFGPGLLDLGAGITKYLRMDSHIKTFYCATARFNVQYALCNVHYAMCNVQCAMCNVQYAMFNVQCACTGCYRASCKRS